MSANRFFQPCPDRPDFTLVMPCLEISQYWHVWHRVVYHRSLWQLVAGCWCWRRWWRWWWRRSCLLASVCVFTVLHPMQRGLATRKLSVRLSVRKRVICEKTKECRAHIMKYHLSYFYEKNGRWRATPSTWNFGSNWPRWSENADFQLFR